mgnify:CR=1 FL=1
MIDEFLKYIAENKLIFPGEKILLGVSGGVDSMVLCDLFLKSGIEFGIAHCNFHLRASESDGDEQLVNNYAVKNSIPYFIIHFDTVAYSEKNNVSIQMAARDLRYNWFNELMDTYGYTKVAVAHHADDNIETFFLNLARSTGLNGLTGIPVQNQRIIRPLLFAFRHDIARYASDNKIDYREDSSNAVDKYARNRIRLNIITEFEKINPAFRRVMMANMEHIQQVDAFVTNELDKLIEDIRFEKAGKYYFGIDKIKESPNRNLLIYHLLHIFGFKNDAIRQIVQTLESSSGKRFFTHTHVLIKDRDYLIVSANDESINEEYFINSVDEHINAPVNLKFELIEKSDSFSILKNNSVAQLDYSKLTFPLKLRKWKHGDSFIPLGMKGRKKLSDYFSDNKYSLFDKQEQWLLLSGNDIVWLVGKQIDDRYKINSDTATILQIGVR